MKDFYQIYVAGHIVPNVEISSVINAHVQVEAANFGDPFISEPDSRNFDQIIISIEYPFKSEL